MRGAPIGWHQHAHRDFSYILKGPPNWVAQTCPQGMFLIFLKGWGLDFPSSSKTVSIKFLLFPSISHQNPFVLIKFLNNSHQIPLVPINNPSKSFCSPQVPKQFPSNSSCSHQQPIKILLFPESSQKVLIKFLLFPLSSHQYPFVPMAMEDRQVSTNVNGETRERLGQSARRSAAVRGQARKGATMAGRRLPDAAERKLGIFCLLGFVEDRGRICISRGSLPRFFLRVRDP